MGQAVPRLRGGLLSTASPCAQQRAALIHVSRLGCTTEMLSAYAYDHPLPTMHRMKAVMQIRKGMSLPSMHSYADLFTLTQMWSGC